MTRFARAKGSKASNERIPEQATPWETMKKDLQKSLKEKSEKKDREKMNKMRQENYEKFLKENEEKVKTTWAAFPQVKQENTSCEKLKVKKKLKQLGKSEKVIVKVEKNESKKDCESPKVIKIKIEIQDTKVEETKPKKLKRKKKFKQLQNSPKEEKTSDETNCNSSVPEIVTKVIKSEHPKKKRKLKASEELTKVNTKRDFENDNVETKKKKLKTTNLTIKSENEDTSSSIKNSDSKTEEHKKSKKKKKRAKKLKQEPTNTANLDEDNKSIEKSFDDFVKKHKDNKQNQNSNQGQKRKAKKRDNREHKRRKSESNETEKIIIYDKEQEIVKFDGFPITKTDFLRLQQLRKKLTDRGVPRSQVTAFIQAERRRSEKFLARHRRKHCFNCRQGGHMLAQCPKLQEQTVETTGTDYCFKCGSTEHTSMACKVRGDTFKFAQCFICKEQGHIARQCPDNPRGLYPDGGACKLCGDVTHFKKDCPQHQEKAEQNAMVLSTISENNLEGLDDEMKATKAQKQKTKIVKF